MKLHVASMCLVAFQVAGLTGHTRRDGNSQSEGGDSKETDTRVPVDDLICPVGCHQEGLQCKCETSADPEIQPDPRDDTNLSSREICQSFLPAVRKSCALRRDGSCLCLTAIDDKGGCPEGCTMPADSQMCECAQKIGGEIKSDETSREDKTAAEGDAANRGNGCPKGCAIQSGECYCPTDINPELSCPQGCTLKGEMCICQREASADEPLTCPPECTLKDQVCTCGREEPPEESLTCPPGCTLKDLTCTCQRDEPAEEPLTCPPECTLKDQVCTCEREESLPESPACSPGCTLENGVCKCSAKHHQPHHRQTQVDPGEELVCPSGCYSEHGICKCPKSPSEKSGGEVGAACASLLPGLPKECHMKEGTCYCNIRVENNNGCPPGCVGSSFRRHSGSSEVNHRHCTCVRHVSHHTATSVDDHTDRANQPKFGGIVSPLFEKIASSGGSLLSKLPGAIGSNFPRFH